MTWEIALGIFALAGFVISICTGVSKLSKTLGVLENTISILTRTITELKQNSHTTHEKLFDRLNKDEKTIENHEIRIKDLEKERSK